MIRKPIIGICGGVSAGKSTLARQFGKLGCAVFQADQFSHEVLKLPEVIQILAQWWGNVILDDDGLVDRQKVGQIVFDNENDRKRLTDLLHPRIEEMQKAFILSCQNNPNIRAIVLDVPLLFEVGQDRYCDYMVFVDSNPSLRLDRVKFRSGWDEERLKKIENLQFALDKKAKMSDYIVENNSDISHLANQAGELLTRILERFRIENPDEAK